jgi:C2H2-type zinc finger/Zinc finger, C2H2 type
VPISDYQCDVCKETFINRRRAQNCLELHDRYQPKQEPTSSKPVTCHICQTEQADAKTLQQHLHDEHGKSVRIVTDSEIRVHLVIKCSCSPLTAFNSIADAISHRKQFHSWSDGPLLVGVRCLLHADGSESTIEKPRVEFTTTTKFVYEFQCICGKNFKSSISSAERCLAMHTNIKNYVCPEEGCGRRCSTKSTLHTHRRRNHGNLTNKLANKGETTVCYICGRTIGLSGLRPHMQWHEMGGEEAAKQRRSEWPSQQARACSICKKVYSNAARMRRHMRTVHQKASNFACKVCDKKFTYHQAAKLCEAKHRGERSVECDYCDRTFYTRSQKLNHEMQSHIKRQNVD